MVRRGAGAINETQKVAQPKIIETGAQSVYR
jgi:hypothetical protein